MVTPPCRHEEEIQKKLAELQNQTPPLSPTEPKFIEPEIGRPGKEYKSHSQQGSPVPRKRDDAAHAPEVYETVEKLKDANARWQDQPNVPPNQSKNPEEERFVHFENQAPPGTLAVPPGTPTEGAADSAFADVKANLNVLSEEQIKEVLQRLRLPPPVDESIVSNVRPRNFLAYACLENLNFFSGEQLVHRLQSLPLESPRGPNDVPKDIHGGAKFYMEPWMQKEQHRRLGIDKQPEHGFAGPQDASVNPAAVQIDRAFLEKALREKKLEELARQRIPLRKEDSPTPMDATPDHSGHPSVFETPRDEPGPSDRQPEPPCSHNSGEQDRSGNIPVVPQPGRGGLFSSCLTRVGGTAVCTIM